MQSDCKNCLVRNACTTDKAKTKKTRHSIYKTELERVKATQLTVKAKMMKRKRSSAVESVNWRRNADQFYRDEKIKCKRTESRQQNVITYRHGL